MASTLLQLIDTLRTDLKDADSLVWSAPELTVQIRRALQEVSAVCPRRMEALLTPAAGASEVGLAALGEVLRLTDCWYPWDTAAPAYPPQRPRRWELLGQSTLAFAADSPPDGTSACQMRLFYAAGQTVEGLDGAAATTLDAAGEGLVVLGAAGYAALQRAQEGVGLVWPAPGAAQALIEWGMRRLGVFRQALEDARRRSVLSGDARGEVRE